MPGIAQLFVDHATTETSVWFGGLQASGDPWYRQETYVGLGVALDAIRNDDGQHNHFDVHIHAPDGDRILEDDELRALLALAP